MHAACHMHLLVFLFLGGIDIFLFLGGVDVGVIGVLLPSLEHWVWIWLCRIWI